MMTISIHTGQSEFHSQINYVCQFITNHPLSPDGLRIEMNEAQADLNINYGHFGKSEFSIPRQELIFNSTNPKIDSLKANPYKTKTQAIYSVEEHIKNDGQFYSEGQFGFDILETIFFHISRYEEYYCEEILKDQWDMMHEKHHFLVKNKLHHIPVVDHIIKEFLSCLELRPKEQNTTFSLTHDIDVLQKFKTPLRIFRSLGRSFLDHGPTGFVKTGRLVCQVLNKRQKDPFQTFDFLLIDSSTYNFKHLVLFIMNGGTSRHDNYYQINDKYLSSVVKKASRLGYKIGLHASYNTDKSATQYVIELDGLAAHFSSKIEHSRQHFLHFNFKKTARHVDDNGISFDSTLGYQRLIGFRCGTGFAYHLYDFSKNRPFKFKELPMVVMDGGLLTEANGDLFESQHILDRFIDLNSKNTHITFNVHNTIFDPTKRDVIVMKKLYRQILSYASSTITESVRQEDAIIRFNESLSRSF